ncbi:hypothetical protein [Chryseobacterium sp. Bi04]|uniref:hypothetical protein n=1 Tax=Chryseobacterium sp. Bi04 TaxID=2822345 RepID=UPI001D409B73|nr:hypothetical protein [Chryseobacterium sp. Bi04]CAH0229391.1 hypothetical protein SRABI04_02682 [Chryseobacterium sp. Bi04]
MALNPEIILKAKAAFEQKCFQLLIDAYHICLTEKIIHLDWNENDISSEIHKSIKKNPLRKKWKVSTNVEADIPKDIQKVKGFADKFPRIDFRLTTFSKNEEYEYFFEAKNLRQNDSALKRRYISTGIDNFVSKKYENGSLVGYLLEGKTVNTINGINSLIIKDKRDSEILNPKSHKLLKESYFESNHSEIGILKHFIFNFTNISV